MLKTLGAALVIALTTACATANTGHQSLSSTMSLDPTSAAKPADSAFTVLGPNANSAAYTAQWQAVLAQCRERLATLEQTHAPFKQDNVLEPLNQLWQVVDRTLSEAGLVRNVAPDPQLRQAAESCEQTFSGFIAEANLSRAVFDAVSGIDTATLGDDGRHWVARLVRDFRRAGVDRDESTRANIKKLQEELVHIGQAFDRNIRQDVRTLELEPEALTGLPEDYIAEHKIGQNGKVTLTTDYPDYVPFMTYAHDDKARRAFYVLFRQRGYPANESVLIELLQKRNSLARLLGHTSWADYITQDKMIGSATHAQQFIDRVDALATPRAQRDYQELLHALQKIDPKATSVADWQKAYLEELVKRDSYQFDTQELRAFFPFGRVRDGVLVTMGHLFGVQFVPRNVPVWHKDVVAYTMKAGDEVLGHFYLDLHPRADKYKHAAAFPMVSGVNQVQLPEASLVCNFPAGENALLSHDDVTTFFHEFGHLLHHLFAGKQKWVGLSGIATESDFVEVPSQLLEEWAFDPATLKAFARRADGAVLDDTRIASLRRVRNLGRGLWVRHQMFYAAVSLAYHTLDPSPGKLASTDTLMRDLQAHYSPFGFVPNTHFQLSFGHLEGYSAIYYTYMWSQVIAKDLLGAFERSGSLNNADTAQRYRDKVLAPGGSKEAAQLVRDFLARDFTFDAFSTWVNTQE